MSENLVEEKAIAETSWHVTSVEECFDILSSSADGIGQDEVDRRQQKYGMNKLPEKKIDSILTVFITQFKDPLIYILLAAGTVSLAIGHASDTIFIFAVLLFNAVLGTIQEYKAQTSAQSLQEVIEQKTTVKRSGKKKNIDAEDLVPGDIVIVEPGQSVPADIRLIDDKDLRVDESLLTGESVPVEKDAGAELEEDSSLAERATMIFAGSTISDGRSTGIVCATGMLTEVGSIAQSLTEDSEEPPLVQRMKRLTRLLALFILVAVAVVAAAQLLAGAGLIDTFFVSIALAVSAIPAGLPVAVTVALSVAAYRMARRHVIVRSLPAVEGLGSCTTICSDKTGTLTQNRLRAKRIVLEPDKTFAIDDGKQGERLPIAYKDNEREPDDEDIEELQNAARAGVLASEEIPGLFDEDGDEDESGGNMVDRAFLLLAKRLDVDPAETRKQSEQVAEIAYSSDKRFAASFARRSDEDAVIASVKGAAETIIDMCDFSDDEERDRAGNLADDLAAEGYRVLAVASGEPEDQQKAEEGDEDCLQGLQFRGLVGLIDPLREEVPDAVKKCHSAGVSVRMVTGDHPKTALSIGRQLGIAEEGEEAISGSELSDLIGEDTQDNGAEEAHKKILNSHIFARVEPAQKTKLVKFLQRSGDFVAVTGDGVNDAPALNAAHISVAMGKAGTDIARRTAQLILGDDNFASIVNGIEEGRIAYDNVRKVVWLLISTSVAELVLFFLALSSGLPIPLFAAQLLWLNLVTNGIQDVALAFEGKEPDILKRRPRRPDERIFNRRMIEQVALSGCWMGLVAYAVYAYLLNVAGYETGAARNVVLLLMVLFENAHILNCRSEYRSAATIRPTGNLLLIGTIILAQAIHIVSMWVPGLSDVLGTAPVSPLTWLVLLTIALTVVMVVELYKKFRVR